MFFSKSEKVVFWKYKNIRDIFSLECKKLEDFVSVLNKLRGFRGDIVYLDREGLYCARVFYKKERPKPKAIPIVLYEIVCGKAVISVDLEKICGLFKHMEREEVVHICSEFVSDLKKNK